jgi:predicted dehydrogenase
MGAYAARGPVDSVVSTLGLLRETPEALAGAVLDGLAAGWPAGVAPTLDAADEALLAALAGSLADAPRSALAGLLARWGVEVGAVVDVEALAANLGARLVDAGQPTPDRVAAAERLVALGQEALVLRAAALLLTPTTELDLATGLVRALGTSTRTDVADALLASWANLGPQAQRVAVATLLRRDAWAEALLQRVAAGGLPASLLDAAQWTQLEQRAASDGAKNLVARARGAAADPDRAAVVERFRGALTLASDPSRGHAVYTQHCAKCPPPSSASASAPSSSRSTRTIPNARCTRSASATQALDAIGKAFGIEKRYTRLRGRAARPGRRLRAHQHADPRPRGDDDAALEAGKHVACTVPMATSVDDCRRIVELLRAHRKKYMMMETVVYAREFLFLKELLREGRARQAAVPAGEPPAGHGRLAGLLAGLPPMYYATHCVGPVLGLPRKDAEYVSCFGSGTIREEMIGIYGSPFAVETAHIKLRNSDLSARIIRSLFDVARQYRESIDVYGTKQAFEWPLIEGDRRCCTPRSARARDPRAGQVPDYAHLLPEGIRKFTTKGVYDLGGNEHLSFTQGGGHGGSHPHLVHEFLRALVEDREPWPNAQAERQLDLRRHPRARVGDGRAACARTCRAGRFSS